MMIIFGRLLLEQKSDWYWYFLILLGCAGAGGEHIPLQAPNRFIAADIKSQLRSPFKRTFSQN
jgi:hypothetical protein